MPTATLTPLFPSMPTPNLCRAAPIVRDYCARIGVPYTDAGLVDSYRQALRYPHDAGAALRRRCGTDPEQPSAAASPTP